MHISEGVLSAGVLATGAVITAAGVAVGLRMMDERRVPEVAVMSSAFFIASLVHFPVGITSAHLLLNGLMGVVLGWASFQALLVALSLQALLFQFGGLSTLGVNTAIMALPAVAAWYITRPLIRQNVQGRNTALAGFLAGSIGPLGSGLLAAGFLLNSGESLRGLAGALVLANIPAMLIEGAVSAFILTFIARVKPAMIFKAVPPQGEARQEDICAGPQ